MTFQLNMREGLRTTPDDAGMLMNLDSLHAHGSDRIVQCKSVDGMFRGWVEKSLPATSLTFVDKRDKTAKAGEESFPRSRESMEIRFLVVGLEHDARLGFGCEGGGKWSCAGIHKSSVRVWLILDFPSVGVAVFLRSVMGKEPEMVRVNTFFGKFVDRLVSLCLQIFFELGLQSTQLTQVTFELLLSHCRIVGYGLLWFTMEGAVGTVLAWPSGTQIDRV